MKTIITIMIILLSSNLSAQIPDFNSEIKIKSETKSNNESTDITNSSNKYSVKIPDELKEDIKKIYKIEEDNIDARGAFNYVKSARRKLDSLSACRSSTYIVGDPEGLKDNVATFSNEQEYNALMLKYSDYEESITKLLEFFKTANALGGQPKVIRGVFPIKSISQAKYFFLYNNDEKSVMFINKLGIKTDFSSSYSASADVITGIIPIKFIPLKFIMATNISQQTSENDSIAANKLNNGGLLNLSLQYPVFFYKWNVEKNRSVIFYMPLEYRFNVDDIKDKIAFSDSYFYHEISTYFMTSIDLIQHRDEKDAATLFGAIKASYYTGGDQFKSKLNDNKFWLYRLTLGIQIKDKYTISANIPLKSSSSSISDQQIASFGITFQPSK